MGVRRYHLDRQAIRDEHIPADEIDSEKLKPNTIQIVIPIVLLGGAAQTVAADAVGVTEITHTGIYIPSNMLKHLKSAECRVDYSWAPTADGTIQFYDTTNAVIRGESGAKTGGETSEWESFVVTGLVEGSYNKIRVKITTAGAAGETVTIYRAALILTLGIS